ncbi:MAG: NifB/NifX family molybdenum-iron cluster-binding protein [Methanotrichaceae archaeon]|nr:NifB/NifX family molybdenum-iron cluster-binding protein [Methanotrichaceae archaeon]
MKICITAGGTGLEAPVDPRFGRCAFFVYVDTESMAVESVPNESAGAASGAGIQAAQNVARKGASVVITGNLGPNAIQTLKGAGVEAYQAQGMTVGDAVERFKRGELSPLSAATSQPQAPGGDIGAGMGAGQGRGGGRGVGGGGRGGAGRGGGQGRGGPR